MTLLRPALLTAALLACVSFGPAPRAAAAEPPVVVFLPGLGDGRDSFRKVQRQLGPELDSFADDRPSSGAGAADGSLSPAEAAKELRQRLRAAGKGPGYLLVAHSIAGLYALEFARLYPDEAAGILLVDARLPGFDSACAAAGIGGCTMPAALMAVLPAAQKAELRGAEPVLRQTADHANLPDLPLTLVVATRPSPGLGGKFQKFWIAYARQAAAMVPESRVVLATGSGHYVQKDAPDLVADEIQTLIARGR